MTAENHGKHRLAGLRSSSLLVVGALVALASTGASSATADSRPEAPAIVAVAGDLDPTFGGDGMITTDLGPEGDGANAIAIQPDGKIVVAGEASFGAEFGLARYNSNGTLDVTFGEDGRVTSDLSPSFGAYAVAIQADGKIVSASGGRRFVLVRYDSDGTLDLTFGSGGVARTNFTPKADVVYAVAIQADGAIVAAGVSGVLGMFRGDPKVAVARYMADGTLDATFGTDGRVTTNFTRTDDRAFAAAIQADGRIVVAGGASAYKDFALARYNPDGTRDSSFGGDGRVTTSFTPRGHSEFATAIAVQGDGKIVAAGVPASDVAFALARYNVDGTLDSMFGGNGRVTTDFLTRHDLAHTGGWARGVAIQDDGKIVAAGGSAVGLGGDTEFALARYNADGTLDPTFGGDGRVTTEWTTEDNDSAFAVAIQTDGKIVVAGTAAYFGPDATFALARYLAA